MQEEMEVYSVLKMLHWHLLGTGAPMSSQRSPVPMRTMQLQMFALFKDMQTVQIVYSLANNAPEQSDAWKIAYGSGNDQVKTCQNGLTSI